MKSLSTLSRTLVVAATLAAAPLALADLNTLEVWGDAVTDGGAALTGTGSGPYEITSGGADFWGASDQGSFAWDNTGTYTTSGDFTATVRHVSTMNPATSEWGRSILGARVSQTAGGPPLPNDPHWFAYRQSSGTMGTGWRETVGGGTSRDFDPATGGDQPPRVPSFGPVTTTPAYLAIARDGNTMRAAHAMDLDGNGTQGRFVEHYNRDIAAFAGGNEVIVGLGHQAHNNSDPALVNTATFDQYNYQGSFNPTPFGPAAGPGTWQVDGSLDVDQLTGDVLGSAFVREGGVATGENTKWTIVAGRTDTFTPAFGSAGAQKSTDAMEAADIIPAANFRINSVSAAGSGLNADIYLAANGNNQTANRAIIDGNAPNGTAIIPNVDWTGGSDNDANYNGLSGPASFGVAVQGVDPASGTAGAFSGNQDSYGVHMTGEIFIPSDANRDNHEFGGEWIQFKDGIDDYTFLAVDGVTLLDDNAWTGRESTQNGGGHVAVMDVSDAKYDDGEWVAFEMIMWEGGGGDAGVLYWDVDDPNGSFDPFNTPGTFAQEAMLMGVNQVGNELLPGDFGLDLSPGEWAVRLTNQNTGTSAQFDQLVTVIPEPSAVASIALGGLALILRRRKRLG